jgi:hypothetical protein
MNTPKKPSWFKVTDLVFFGIPFVGTSALAIYMMVAGFEAKHPLQALILMWVVAVGFLVGYLVQVKIRRDTLARYEWYPNYGFMLRRDEYILPSHAVLDACVGRTIAAWTPYHPNAEEIVKSQVNWVSFIKDLDENDKNRAHMKVNGFTVAVSHTMAIDYDNIGDPFEKTAFEHELGHVIRGFATGNWDMEEHHAFAKAHKIK